MAPNPKSSFCTGVFPFLFFPFLDTEYIFLTVCLAVKVEHIKNTKVKICGFKYTFYICEIILQSFMI